MIGNQVSDNSCMVYQKKKKCMPPIESIRNYDNNAHERKFNKDNDFLPESSIE